MNFAAKHQGLLWWRTMHGPCLASPGGLVVLCRCSMQLDSVNPRASASGGEECDNRSEKYRTIA
jgi:hypothetical protein